MAVADDSTKFYVYVHRRATNNTIFYVGKGCGARVYKTIGRNKHWQNIVAKHGVIKEIVLSGLTEKQAIDLEVELISHYGRANLCNLTDGGEGMSGHVKSLSARQAVSKAHIGVKRSSETCKRISESLIGRILTEDCKSKISQKLKGQILSESTRRAMSIARTGKKHSEERKAKIAKAWRVSPERYAERCKAMSDARPVVPVSCIDTDAKFRSLKEATAWLKTLGHEKANHSKISLCCRGKRKTAYGYRWRYA